MTFGFTAWLLGTITVLFIVLIRFYIITRNANLREEAERENELREINRLFEVEEGRRQLQHEAMVSALKQRLKSDADNRAKAAVVQPTEKPSIPRRKPTRKVPAASAVIAPSSTTAPKKPNPRTPRKPRSVAK